MFIRRTGVIRGSGTVRLIWKDELKMRFSSFVVVIGLTALLTSGCAIHESSRFGEREVSDPIIASQRSAIQACRQSRMEAGQCTCFTCVSNEVNSKQNRQHHPRFAQQQLVAQQNYEIQEPAPRRNTPLPKTASSHGSLFASKIVSSRTPKSRSAQDNDESQNALQVATSSDGQDSLALNPPQQPAGGQEISSGAETEIVEQWLATDAIDALGINSLSSTLALTESELPQLHLDATQEIELLRANDASDLRLDNALQTAAPEVAEENITPAFVEPIASRTVPEIPASVPVDLDETPLDFPRLVPSQQAVSRSSTTSTESDLQSTTQQESPARQTVIESVGTPLTPPSPALPVQNQVATSPTEPVSEVIAEVARGSAEVPPARDDATQIAAKPVVVDSKLVLRARTSGFDEAFGENDFLKSITRGANAKAAPVPTRQSDTPNPLGNSETVYFSPLPSVRYPSYTETHRNAQPVRYSQPVQQLQSVADGRQSEDELARITADSNPDQPQITIRATQLPTQHNLAPIRKSGTGSDPRQPLMLQASSPRSYDATAKTTAAARIIRQSQADPRRINPHQQPIRLRATAGNGRGQNLAPVVDLRLGEPTQPIGTQPTSGWINANPSGGSTPSRQPAQDSGSPKFQTPRTPIIPNSVPSLQNVPQIDFQQMDDSIRHLTVKPDDNTGDLNTIDR